MKKNNKNPIFWTGVVLSLLLLSYLVVLCFLDSENGHYEHNIDPFLYYFDRIGLGPSWYGLSYVVSFVLGFFLVRKNYQQCQVQITPAKYETWIYYLIFGIMIGARLGYAFIYRPAHYLSHPWEILMVWEGGMSFHGGVIGVLTAALIFCKKNKYHFYTLADPAMPLVALGIGFVRIANYINGELYGKITTLPWAVIFPDENKPGFNLVPRHPSQLYESLLEGFLMSIFLQLLFLKTKTKGLIFWVFMCTYGIIRYFIEFIRLPDDLPIYEKGMIFGFLSMGQLLSLLMIVSSIVGMILMKAQKNNVKFFGVEKI